MKVRAASGDSAHVESSPSLALPDVGVELDIDQLYAAHAPFLTRVLMRLVGDNTHVDDLLQETFIVAYRKRHTFDGRSAARTWLYGIAARLAQRHRRGTGRLRRALGLYADEPTTVSAPGPEHELARVQASLLVRAALDDLPFKQREVFVLYELEELDGAAIADMLGIPVNTVWTRLHHGRKRFEERVRKHSRKEGT